MKLRPYKNGDLARVRQAVALLRAARYLLKEVGAKKSVDRIRKALKSAEGAERHVSRLADHADRARLGTR